MRLLFVAIVLSFVSTSLAACCGAGCPPRTTTHGASSSSSAAHGALAPRMDLHCTPQSADEESKCLAQGDDRNYGPPLVCRGTPPPPELEEAERKAWEQGTSPCVCYTDHDEQMCHSVP